MAVRGLEQTRRNLRKLTDKIGKRMTEKAITEVLIIGEGYAASLAPIDTGNLLQSMYRELKYAGPKITGRVGFTANYAAAVHDAEGILDGLPRDPNNPSRGDFWDPDAEPEFLKKAFERDGRADIDATFKRYMKL